MCNTDWVTLVRDSYPKEKYIEDIIVWWWEDKILDESYIQLLKLGVLKLGYPNKAVELYKQKNE